MGIKGDKYWVLDKRGSWLQHGVINATTGMGLILLAPLFVFIGMSYIPGSQFRNVWNAIVTVLYFCSFVFMSYYILGSIFQTSVNLWLVAAGWCSLVVLYGSGALLGLLGLLPVQAYLGSLLFFALVALALYSLLFSMVLRHKAPLLRAYSFMEKGRVVLVTICLLPITRIAHDLLFKFSMRGDDLQSVIYDLFCLIALIWILRAYSTMTCDHSKRRRRHETTIRLTFVVVAVVESIGWWISGEFSFWWFSLLFLVTTIWYSSQSANALKGFRLVTSMTAVFCLFGALSGFDFEFTGIPKALASSLGNILKVVSILWSVFAYCWSRRLSGEKSKSSDRSRIIEQVHLACKEVLEEEDSNFTVYSKIVHICLAEAQYKYCRKLLQKGRKLDVKLGHYFKIYVDCAQFYDLGRIHVDGRSFTSNDTQDFKQYMENRFLAIVGLPLQVWELFRRNDLVCRFIRVKTIENRKPKSKLRSFLDSLRYVVFSLVIVSLVVGPLPATGFGCLLPVFRKVFLYPKKRLTEARLQFVLAFQPYTQDKYRLHYAAHLYDVAQRIGRYEGTRNAAGSLQLDAGTIGRLIEIYELILSFEETRSTVYCAATTELGHLYYCDGQFERAKEAYEKALERVTDLGDRDYLLRRIVEILQNTNEEVVLSLLEEIERSPNDYPRSRPFLSKVYLLKGDYAALERIVRAVNTDLQAPDYFFLGKCHAHKDDPEKAMESFLQAEKRVREHEDQRVKTLVACGLGAWYLSEGRFSDAADMYCCFFVTKVMNDFWLDESQTKENLKRLSECIDRVIKERPGDARLCLWQFLFHHIGGDTKKAEPFLEMYLSSTNMYEYEFKRFLKRRLRAAGPVSSGL